MKSIFTILILFSTVSIITYGCKDILNECRKYKDYCKILSWRSFLFKNCQYTCKVCEDDLKKKDGGDECDDIGENCNNIKFYCKNPKYDNITKRLCKRSCGLC
uniref:ShKT domain-containing protein n=1 Tax=Strongyloides papillosus TaxID=174720 RepID=A0A0N5BXE6_STREA